MRIRCHWQSPELHRLYYLFFLNHGKNCCDLRNVRSFYSTISSGQKSKTDHGKSSPAVGNWDENLGLKLKSFEEIEREMFKRSLVKDTVPYHVRTHIKKLLNARVQTPPALDPQRLYQRVAVGDLLLVNLTPVVVVSVPQQIGAKLKIANAEGNNREISLNQIDARLGQLLPLTVKFVGKSGSIGSETHALLAFALRQFYVKATTLATRFLDRTTKQLAELAHEKTNLAKAVTLPYLDFVKRIVGSDSPTQLDFYAVRLCLEHYSLINKYLLDFHYFGKYSLTVIPAEVEKRQLEMLALKNPASASQSLQQQYLADYALGNLPGNESESCALELLKIHLDSHGPTGSLDPTAAAAFVFANHKVLDWPYIDRLRYDWFTKARSHLNLDSIPDRLSAVRKPFDQSTVYCIDPEDVREVDDGISWTIRTPDTGTLGIHIADPTSFVNNKQLIERVADIPATVHLKHTYFPLLPKEVTSRLQLGPNKSCLSILIDIDLKAKEIINTPRLCAHTLGNNVIFTTYDRVNARLNSRESSENPWAPIHEAASILRQSRKGFDVSSGELTPAASMVAECMVYASSAIAQMCHNSKVPIPYRSQEVQLWSTQEYDQFSSRSTTGVVGFKWKEAIRKSIVSDTPLNGHSGLGVPAYTQFTSPLRRGEDLFVHIQATDVFLLGKSPSLTHHELKKLLPWLQVGMDVIKESQRGSQRFDRLVEIEKDINRPNAKPLRGVVSSVSRADGPNLSNATGVWLPDLNLFATIERQGVALPLDTEAWFKITRISSVSNTLVVDIM